MRNKRKKRNLKNFVFIIFIVSFLISILIIHYFLFKNKNLISPVPISLLSNGKKIFLSNVSGNSLESLLKKFGIPYSSILLSTDSSYLIKLNSGEEVVLSSKKDLNVQVASLQLILNRLKIEGKGFTRLDLRFDKPVIVFEKI